MRQEKEIIITSGRDRGKKFMIREMSAYDTEMWANRAVAVMAQHYGSENNLVMGVILSLDDAINSNEQADAVIEKLNNGEQIVSNATEQFAKSMYGLWKGLPFEVTEPFNDQLLSCCEIFIDPKNSTTTQALSINKDLIKDPKTIIRLRHEALMLHIGFFTDAVRLILARQFLIIQEATKEYEDKPHDTSISPPSLPT